MPSPPLLPLLLLLLLLSFSATTTFSSHHHRHHHHNHSTTHLPTTTIHSLCNSTPHPSTCLSALELTINLNPSFLTSALYSLQSAISEATNLTPHLLPSSPHILEHRRGSLQDCSDLHSITLSSLLASASFLRSPSTSNLSLSDVNAHLSAALTNKNTCLEGLSSASGPAVPDLLHAISDAYKNVGNALSLVSRRRRRERRLAGGYWRRVLEDGDTDAVTVTVAKDGTGNFTTVGEAVAFVPSNSPVRTFVWIKAGVYEENVDIGADKPNIVLLGEGRDVTVIRGRRNAADGWTSFRSATVGVSGQGFLARDITFENVAGVDRGQAVALRVNADKSAFYRCTISGFQDTLYVHSFRQFYRECNIYGTIDFIFGNAAVVFQACNIMARLPVPGQSNVITAQSRDDPNEETGISIDRCSILAADDLAASPDKAKTYLGRPWLVYSRTVVMETYIDSLVDPAGWLNWEGDKGLDTLYYGEYENSGPGSDTSNRVDWAGFHQMEYDEAVGFSVSEFIDGDQWLGDTSFPYDDGV